MKCKQYQDYESGRLSKAAFQAHIKTCADCQKQLKADEHLLDLASQLKHPIEASYLWDRIEKSLEQEIQNDTIHPIRFRSLYRTLGIAAAIVLLVGMGYLLRMQTEVSKSGLLSDSVLTQVEREQEEYMATIEALEKQVKPKLDEIDVELALLYRDRLATIDAQIERCREASTQNPANAHIRRHMLAALQDKKETLNALLDT